MSSLLVFTRVYISGDTVSHVGIFDPSCETSAHLTFSLVHLPPPPPRLPCVNKYSGMYHTECKRGGGIWCLRQINTCFQAPLLDNF
jgi:hypothetical protein